MIKVEGIKGRVGRWKWEEGSCKENISSGRNSLLKQTVAGANLGSLRVNSLYFENTSKMFRQGAL